MRLASIRDAAGFTGLHAVSGERAVSLSEAANRSGVQGLGDLADVADLYRRGPATVEAARLLVESLAADPEAGAALPDRLVSPVGDRIKLICVGLNYREHAIESGLAIPDRPVLFAKYSNTIVGHGDDVIKHAITERLDYEVELGVVIGRRARGLTVADAMSAVAGYTIVNDVSGRDLQFSDVQWLRGKTLDTWAPIGPVFVSVDEIPDPHALQLGSRVDGEVRQSSHTGDMIFRVPELLAFITEAITLEPGDIIATGTPQGVGMGFDPPRYLADGSVVEAWIEGIGSLRNPVVAAARA